MPIKHTAICCLFALLFTGPVSAQYYSSGEGPASAKWQQINTPHYRLVFPSTFTPYAKRIASILDTAYRYTSATMGSSPRKTRILVHSYSAYSNGFMSWAPKRMELYPTPPQDGMTQDWINHLVLHEHRHLVQTDYLNRGFLRGAGWLFGQHAIGVGIGVHYPMWFLEGDAVLTETLLTRTGRGRMPWFANQLKAQMLEKGIYSYDKAYMGSYRDFVPNYYVMGYHLVTGARQQFGTGIWQDAVQGIAGRSWYPWQFSKQLKRQTGLNKTALYNAVFDSLRLVWQNEDGRTHVAASVPVTPQPKRYKSYLYPQALPNGHLVAEVSGPGETTRFVEIDARGHERTVVQPGARNDEPFGLTNHKMVWSEQKAHLRWANAASSIIKMYDMQTGTLSFVGPRNKKLFAPSLSPDETRVAVVDIADDNRALLAIIDVQSGKIEKQFDLGADMLITPKWIDNQQILLIAQTQKGKELIVFHTLAQSTTRLLGPTHHDIRYPSVHQGKAFFGMDRNGQENVFMIDLASKQTTQLSSERFGATSPALAPNGIVYSRYTADGYQVVCKDTLPANDGMADRSILFNGLEEKELGVPDFSVIDTSHHEVRPYSKWNLFNFHSWAPLYVDLDDQGINQGISFMSQNLLNTMFVEAGYNADRNYRTEKYVAKLTYKGLFPQFDLTVKVGDSEIFYDNAYRNETDTFYLKADAKRLSLQILPGVSIPLRLSRGAWNRYLSPSAKWIYYKQTGYHYQMADVTLQGNHYLVGEFNDLTYPDFVSQGMEYDLFGYNLKRGNQHDIGTRWGQVWELNYRHSPWGGHSRGSQLAALTRLYFPGIGRYHAIKLENNWQWRTFGELYGQTGTYLFYRYFTSVVQLPRGYANTDAKQLYSFRGDYMMPLASPDWSVGGLAYVKRITTSLFYDFTHARYSRTLASNLQTIRFNEQYTSVGTDIRAEVHVARFILPLEIGCRVAYLPGNKQFYSEMLLNMNLSGYLVNK
ncbi:MAG: hypothetical protein QM786_12865 [Breznakibacter sp.]